MKKGYLISFSGFDGVGKSTQINLLSKYLKSKGKKVYVTETMFGYFLLKPVIKILRPATGSLSLGPVKRNKNFLAKLWFIPAFIDIWISYIFKISPMLNKYDYVIADRFYTDIWANLLYYGYIPDSAFKVFIKLLPRPDIAIMLSVDPKLVLKRESEFPPAYYQEQAIIYQQLSHQINFYQVNAGQDPKIVFLKIKNLLK